jgi:probable HAF family extracellular repeat protein
MKTGRVMRTIAITIFAVLTIPTQMAAQQLQAAVKGHRRYAVIDLGTLGGTFSQAFGLNNKGSAVGFATTANDTSLHAFLWRRGKMIDLGSLGGNDTLSYSQAVGVSEVDEVAGFSETSVPDPLGENFCGDSLVCLPVVWKDGVMTKLPILDGNNGLALGISGDGQVVGQVENAILDPTCVAPQVLQFKPVVWEEGKIKELPTFPGSPDGIAASPNDRGEEVGASTTCSQNPSRAVLWHHGKIIDLGNLGGTSPAPNGMNNESQVVGLSDLPGGAVIHAFLWQRGAMTDLGTLPGDLNSFGNAINDKGQAVGQSCDQNGFSNCRVFLWEHGAMTDLNVLVPADSPLHLFDPSAINSRGEIAGLAIEKDTGALLAFLAVPCDEDHPGVGGCDYTPVDAAVASKASAASGVLARSAAAVASLTPSTAKDRVRTLEARQNRKFKTLTQK